MHLRMATEADVPALADLYRSVVEAAGPAYYSAVQVKTWAAFARDETAFAPFILRPRTVVAEDDDGPLGFSGLDRDGHVASLYVAARSLRRGIGSMLLQRVIAMAQAEGMSRLYAETGAFSLPLFQKFGFRLTEIETVSRGEATFERYIVERLGPEVGSSAHNVIEAQYERKGLYETILTALVAAGKDIDALTVDDLAPVDAFHIRGRAATEELAEWVRLEAKSLVLDVGCGLGGTSRYLASSTGCEVIGVDLTEAYCDSARKLSERIGLAARTRFYVADALALPFPNDTFDVVWTEHVQMNVANKSAFYGELARVLKPGGTLAIHEILAGATQEILLPVPWADRPTISHLIGPDDLHDLLAALDFRQKHWRDVSAVSLAFLEHRNMPPSSEEHAAVGLHLLMGDGASEKIVNLQRNLQQERIRVVQAVYELG